MGVYAIGSECCNNCVHWNCHSERKIRGNPPKEVYTDSNCDKCDLTGRSTLSKDSCGMFRHIGGITRTFKAQEKHDSSDYVMSSFDSFDESTRSYCQSLVTFARNTAALRDAKQRVSALSYDADDLDDEDEIELSRDLAQGRANERSKELSDEGMDSQYFYTEMAVKFMRLLDAAKEGDGKAQYVFAQALWRGVSGAREEGVKNRGGKGWYWCNKAAENGYGYAQLMRGITYRNDAVESGDLEDHKKAVDWLEKALSHSEIIDKDSEKDGVYLKALNSSRITLGVSYINGKKGTIDFHKAMSYFGAVEDSGDSRGGEWKKKVDDLCKELKESLQNMKDAAEYGSDDALNILGMIYGGYSEYKQYQLIVEVDRQKSFEYFQKAAYADNPDAMDNLGNCFKNGDGVEKDIAKAVEWYKKAAEIGWPSGLFHYATCLRKGNGVEKDEKEAIKWYMKAGIGGHAKALNVLGWCAEGGRGMNEDPELAFEWYRLAAEAGDAESMYDLGRCYMKGYGCVQNESLGEEWQEKAKENGYRAYSEW